MARQLGDAQYDACVKDFARCSFAVPREYVLFVDEERLFSPSPIMSFRAKRRISATQRSPKWSYRDFSDRVLNNSSSSLRSSE